MIFQNETVAGTFEKKFKFKKFVSNLKISTHDEKGVFDIFLSQIFTLKFF